MSDASTTATGTSATATTQAAAATTAAVGTAAKPWFEGKADLETIGHWDNKGWKKDDPVTIAIEATKQARELQKHFGVPETQLLKLPKDTADEAGWRAVYSRLGAPADPKEYDLSSVKTVGGAALPEPFVAAMQKALGTAFVPKDKAAGIVSEIVKFADAERMARDTVRNGQITQEKADLDKNWGTNKDLNRIIAAHGAQRLGFTEAEMTTMAEAASTAGIPYNRVVEAFHRIGVGTSEDTFHGGGQNSAPTTQNGAKAQLAQLMADPAWGKRLTAGDAATKREFDNLMLTIHGQAA